MKEYESLVLSRTFDIVEKVMYPEKISKMRNIKELERLITEGHVVEIRDGYSNVTVDSLEMLNRLYGETQSTVAVDEDTTDVNTSKIQLPNGVIVDINTLMTVTNENGDFVSANIPNNSTYIPPSYLTPSNDSLPTTGLNIETATTINNNIEETKVEEPVSNVNVVVEETTNKKKKKN